MDDAKQHLRNAARIIADLLASSLMRKEEAGISPYIWELDGLDWLARQWHRDPGTIINMWAADRVRARPSFSTHPGGEQEMAVATMICEAKP